ncbi:MAG TPA: hypothetical protein VK747_23500 [Blastocatellia bacterium]|nr:hypothetical protein [Blastocatellia bacterium]
MAEIGVLKVGDRVTQAGQGDVFFVLHLDFETLSATLLPSDTGPLLAKIPVETLAILPRPVSNGATTG